MKVYLIFDGMDFADIICSNISDAEEMILALTEEELYKDFLRYNSGKHNVSYESYVKDRYSDAKRNNENCCQTFEGWMLLNFHLDRFSYVGIKVIE